MFSLPGPKFPRLVDNIYKELVWHINGPASIKTDVGPAYRIRGAYRPVEVWARMRDSGILSKLTFDINDDGVSLFTTPPSFNNDGAQASLFRIFKPEGADAIEDSSVVTLDIDSKGGHDVTIILYLEEIRPPDPDEGVA